MGCVGRLWAGSCNNKLTGAGPGVGMCVYLDQASQLFIRLTNLRAACKALVSLSLTPLLNMLTALSFPNQNNGSCNELQPLCCYWLIWPIQNDAKNAEKMTETLAHEYSSESSQRELSNEYQHNMFRWVSKIFVSLCFGRNPVASALEGLDSQSDNFEHNIINKLIIHPFTH